MKKIDFHIHTVASISDEAFQFSLDKFNEYVEATELDAVAVTNHNLFDASQFEDICASLTIPVYPGIEINLCKCHLLLIADQTSFQAFTAGANQTQSAIVNPEDSISVEQLKDYFGDLGNYLLIPHYAKKKAIQPETLAKLRDYVAAGEVDSPKKFVRALRDASSLPPVIFSDTRISADLDRWSLRQTFVDCGEPTFSAIKTSLADKKKLALSRDDGNKLFPGLPDGTMISTGLNVVLGKRSAGKSVTLDGIDEFNENAKYIKQFQLVQRDEERDERDFNDDVERRRRNFADQYLQGFKAVVDDIESLDKVYNDRSVEEYVESLLTSADEADKQDSFSKTELYNETAFSIASDKPLEDLIGSVRQLIENVDHREVIQKHVDSDALRRLARELIEDLWSRRAMKRRKNIVNDLVTTIREQLQVRSSAPQVKDVDLYSIALDSRKIQRFEEIVSGLRRESVIDRESVQGFEVVTEKRRFHGAGELKKCNGNKGRFSDVIPYVDQPFEYLQRLKDSDFVASSDYFRLFANVTHRILNKHGADVSGGERSEYRLLREIKDAQNFDILLIDEPESSFDNLFLSANVNQLLKHISASMPVVVVTHNNTVGASIGADYLVYAEKTVHGRIASYRLYTGHPTATKLTALDGATISTHELLMDSLEAGCSAYEQRRNSYEAVKD